MARHLQVPGPDEIAAIAQRSPLDLPEGAAAKLGAWLAQMADWNQRLDLTAARTTGELCDLMLADAFVLAGRIPPGVTVVDVGTGAGAPGLALAVARPDLRVTLVEPLAKRVAFLRTVLAAIGRNDVGLLRAKDDDLEVRFDVALARATFAPAEWIERGARLVIPGGSVWVLLAKEAPPASEHADAVEDVAYTWPATGVTRRAVRYRVRAG